MIIVISKIKVKTGRLPKIIPLVRENAQLGLSRPGCLSTYVANNEDNPDEILVYTRWTDHNAFEEAKKEIKKDSKIKRIAFQLFPYLAQEPSLEIFEVIPV